METVQIATLILVSALFLLEGIKITSSFAAARADGERREELERVLEALEAGEVSGTIKEIELPKKKD